MKNIKIRLLKYRLLLIILTFVISISGSCSSNEGNKIYIFAAASTTEAVKELVELYRLSSKSTAGFKMSFASSGNLAKQIEAGADADIFISANIKWYNYLEEKDLTEKSSAFTLAENSLVLISSKQSGIKLNSPEQLAKLPGEIHIAMGDPAHVPAGKYGKEALEYYRIWNTLSSKKKLAFYPDVRKTLNSVETSQADFGIVYMTDAMSSNKITIMHTFAVTSHKPITYPVCAVKGKDKGEASAFLQFLKSDAAKNILKKYGFSVK